MAAVYAFAELGLEVHVEVHVEVYAFVEGIREDYDRESQHVDVYVE